MPDDLWRSDVGPTHPQYAMKMLLDALGVAPVEVDEQGGRDGRTDLVRHAMLPATATAAWQTPRPAPPALRAIEAATPAEEARVIALAIRETLETKGKTVALVTPDRSLARRVAATLRRWDIGVDDSAGTPLSKTPPGAFLLLLAEAWAQQWAPVPLLALLKHPLSQSGAGRMAWLARVRQLDRDLRGLRPAPGLPTGAPELLNEVDALFSAAPADLRSKLDALIAAADLMVPVHGLWRGEAGRALADLLAKLSDADGLTLAVSAADMPELLGTLLSEVAVRPPFGAHPRAFIWGPVEARLQRADLMILGGLSEGIWPPAPDVDPFLSDAMRAALGLPTSEFRLGQSAHDFAQALGAPEVLLTRSSKGAEGPLVASRFWLRLDAVAAGGLPRDEQALQWARALDWSPLAPRACKPNPKPPVAVRPTQLSVTQIETWRRDPYALYARHILRLEPLDPLDQDPSAADKGNAIHAALADYVQSGGGLPALMRAGTTAFGPLLRNPLVRALWWPRFERIARWFIDQQATRAGVWRTVVVEDKQAITLDGFTLTGKPDRIDVGPDGFEIIDYKTGSAPSKKAIEAGYALQLQLLAMMAQRRAWPALTTHTPTAPTHWLLKGGAETVGEIKTLKVTDKSIAEVIADAEQVLRDLIAAYQRPETGYPYQPRPEYAPYHDYDHLARAAEWQGRDHGE
jgi:ATP-dependent helicase/nuclease subunit B